MSLKRLLTNADTDKYRLWLAAHSTEWLMARLERHPEYYNGLAVSDRIHEVKNVLFDRKYAEEEAV